MKLFGLVETVTINFGLSYRIPMPHEKLFEKLEEYGSGLSAGLQMCNAKKVVKIHPLELHQQKIFLDLLRRFKSKDCQIYFLESKEHFRNVCALVRQGNSLYERICQSENGNKFALKNELDKLKIRIDYMLKLGCEEGMLEKIAALKPDLVFLGDAHAARFYRRRDELREKHCINIEEYWHDVIVRQPSQEELLMAMSSSTKSMPTEKYLESHYEVDLKKVESEEDCIEDLEGSRVERLYKSSTQGRVTDGNPHFIGTWDTTFEHRGLFEVYVQKVEADSGALQLEGVIEDVNGSADFIGAIEGDFVKFCKEYTRAGQWAAKGEILYVGKMTSSPP